MDQQDQKLPVEQATKISLPRAALPILNSIEPAGDGYRAGQILPPITAELKEAAKITRFRVEQRLERATPEYIKGAVVTSLMHFYVGDLPQAVYAAIQKQWVGVLAEYPTWAIDQAFIERLKQDTARKPLPGEIYKICRRLVSKDRAVMIQAERIIRAKIEEPEPELTPEQRAQRDKEISQMVAEATRNLTSHQATA